MAKVEITETIDQMTKRFVILALERTKGNKLKACRLLGISNRTLYRKIINYNIDSKNLN